MRQVRCFTMPLLAVLAVIALPDATAAQPAGATGPPRAEIWGAWAILMPVSNGTVDSAYEQSAPWAPTTGTLGYRSLAIGGVVRWRTASGRAGVRSSA